VKVAVLVAHPDDEVLGVGGTIRRHVAQGDEVRVHIECMSGLRDKLVRISGALQIAKNVGYQLTFGDSQNLGHTAPDLDRFADAEVIYTHWLGDLNRDHRLVAEAALVAGRCTRTIRMFETVSSTEWGTVPFVPDYYVAIDPAEKIDLLKHYRSEMRDPPHPRSDRALWNLAELRGSTVGLPAAEAFHTVRDVWR
jgi:LmbE family N-acetylglucosaminyl deacetylase